MQKKKSIPNADRRAMMRARLIAEARNLFVEKGYAETSTPEIVRAAEVTRGALYHHFADKADLFRAVVQQEAATLAAEIDQGAVADSGDPLTSGSRAFFASMAKEGRARLLLIEGPAVLGLAEMAEIDAGGGRQSLMLGLQQARPDLAEAELQALSDVLSAAFDRAALAVSQGQSESPYLAAMEQVMASLMAPSG
ncbi:Potential acrAB operon repressor [Thalassovita autumnalis]|uniref:Potential acrAB operon repressor n=1 Tax=Thalassovita autumnalis TaxID=2072972 RepID=A0A0P1FWJ4_9RHOB|nr:TetR/AcrR family transcriptional regulator [Thalassovita autumnalis]CUH68087.1 Potential acrAB operon repressor [Thalassovita autumnalis]CUH73339.1 Potential acrAB operon repressor [Thalassovita autumnalis]